MINKCSTKVSQRYVLLQVNTQAQLVNIHNLQSLQETAPDLKVTRKEKNTAHTKPRVQEPSVRWFVTRSRSSKL